MLLDALTEAQQAILLGSILADGEITKCYPQSRRKNNSYREHFGESQRFYREWKMQQLSDLLYIRQNYLVSKSIPLLTELYPLFYPQHLKVIPMSLLPRCEHLLFLLTLYLDDGSLMISKRLNRKGQLFVTPSIALYLQSFPLDQLTLFCRWLNETFSLNFRVSKTPNGSGYFLKTTRVTDALDFLKPFTPYTAVLSNFSYKLNWSSRLEQLKQDHPNYEIVSSSPSRPYTVDECSSILQLKEQGWTTQEIADELNRTYWSVTYKFGQLKKAMERVHDLEVKSMTNYD